MANLNEVRLIGRLTRDPELRTTPSGSMVASFGLATNRKWKGADGNYKEETTFVDITCWGRLAETVHRYMAKGRQIFVAGRLRFESWVDKQTGGNRSKLTVVADNVQFLDSPANQESAPTRAPYQAPVNPGIPDIPVDSNPAPPFADTNSWEPPMDEPPF